MASVQCTYFRDVHLLPAPPAFFLKSDRPGPALKDNAKFVLLVLFAFSVFSVFVFAFLILLSPFPPAIG